MTRIHSEVTAGCEGGQVTPKAGHKTLCTVTYQGAELTWDVWVSDISDSGPTQFIRCDVYPPDSGVLLTKAVRPVLGAAPQGREGNALRPDPHLQVGQAR